MAFVNLSVGDDRIVVTAFNPSSDLTLLKAAFVLEAIATHMNRVPEEAFRAWVASKPGGHALLTKLEATPNYGPIDLVDPRNAHEERRILDYLQKERLDQAIQRRKHGG